MTLQGIVERITFAAPGSSFGVVQLRAGDGTRATLVGPLGNLQEGERIEVEGEWETNAKFGKQLRVAKLRVSAPTSTLGLKKFLATFDGIGEVLAGRLVEVLGKDVLDVIEREPWRVAQIPLVGKARADKLAQQLKERRDERDSLAFLYGLGLGRRQAERLLEVRGTAVIAEIRNNPYRLIGEVAGFGFRRADALGQALGIAPDAEARLAAALLHALDAAVEDGHTLVAPDELAARAAELVGQPVEHVVKVLDQLLADGRHAVRWQEAIGSRRHLELEESIAADVLRLCASRPRATPRAHAPAHLADGQRRALELCAQHPLVVVTGGPGTGKTTIVRTLCELFAGSTVALCAPTGRAARRLEDATGHVATTLHRLLEWRPLQGGSYGPQRGREHPIDADVIVVDEASMLDIELGRLLLQAVSDGPRLVFCGDVAQLPSVGPGQVLADLIASQRVPVALLTEVFRQQKQSGILDAAYRVLRGELPSASPTTQQTTQQAGDFFWVEAEGEAAAEKVERIIAERIPAAFSIDPIEGVQALSPMHKGPLGTVALNQRLQARLNPGGRELKLEHRVLRRGDRLMCTRNDYEREVYNGDIGQLTAVDEDKGEIEVAFEQRRVRYPKNGLADLELAYAISIHKSQGSEYPAAVVALGSEHFVMLRRNLLYTAMTRARRLLVLVGSRGAVRRAVETPGALRRTTLAARLQRPG